MPIPQSVRKLPGRVSKATNELVFPAEIPPFGYAIYAVKKRTDSQETIQPETASSIGSNVSQQIS